MRAERLFQLPKLNVMKVKQWMLQFLLGLGFAVGIRAQGQTCGGFISYQGQRYATVQIGNQCWLAENMRATENRDGESIPLLTSTEAWSEQVLSPARCEIQMPGEAEPVLLYNRWAAQEVCPSGWHLPSLEEWNVLASKLGGWGVAGYTMKSKSSWHSLNNRTNASGFNAKPHGMRDAEGAFKFQGEGSYWWTSSDENLLMDTWFVWIEDETMDLFRYSFFNTMGFSVRCIQSNP